VTFQDDLRDLSVLGAGEEPSAPDDSFEGLRHRLDSRLLVVLGASKEDAAREGIGLCLWDDRRLKRVAFVPRAKACAAPK
jgi:hypothetical protein